MFYFDPSRDIRILHNQQCMSNNAMNDTVMKAHQNRDMTYDEMNDYEMFNEAAHPARGNLLSIYGIINDITVQCSTSVN